MQKNIKYNKIEKCFLINDLIKIDSEYVDKIINKRNIENLIKQEDNLYYYKNKSLIELLFDINNYQEIIFKNNNTDDYRFNNLIIKLNDTFKFKEPDNVTILENGKSKLITIGAHANEERNYYWKVRDNQNNEYYIMHINDNIYTKFSIQDKQKILDFNGNRPTWYLHSSTYIATMIEHNNKKVTVYLHQYIMDVHFEDNSNMKKTIDHINHDKYDNRKENLRFANMSEQNSNRDKQKRQKNACPLPEGIQQSDLPIYVCYNKRCYDKEKDSWREFFTIHWHPKLDKRWASSKSNNVSIKEKLDQAKLKLKHLNNEITDIEYKKIVEPEYKLFKGLRLSIDNKYNKYKFEYDDRSCNTRFNYNMILTHNDLQLMIDKFIDLLNDKYKDNKEYNKKEYYKLEKNVLLDFSSVNNEIIDDNESDSEESNIKLSDSDNKSDSIKKPDFKQIPDLPPNFSLYKEKDSWYLSYSKKIDTIRYNKKNILKCLCIQTELNKLINDINEKYPNLKIQDYIIKNLYDFIDKTPLKKSDDKPSMPVNFSICTINGVKHIQFCKKIDGIRRQYKTTLKSDDIPKELNKFIEYLNTTYKLEL